MFCTERSKLRLLTRNEGKIKSYDSCFDVRAWSHDIQTRNRYIRDWIKCDMPICVIPVCTVASFLRTMTWRGRGRHKHADFSLWKHLSKPHKIVAFTMCLPRLVTRNRVPLHYLGASRASLRCHPDCKSKVVLDSICTSCHAMKECLRNDQEFEQYFDEEDFETAHWPCERCLDALKSIKMLWKIILERIFKISIPRSENFESSCSSNESVKTVTKAWQDEMVQQTMVVKNLTPYINSRVNFKSSNDKPTTRDVKKDSILRNTKKKDHDNLMENSIRIKINTVCNSKHKSTDTDDMFYKKYSVKGSCGSLREKLSRSTSFKVKTIDAGCDACYKNDEELNIYKSNLEYLQQRFNIQSDELRRLKSENIAIKMELRYMLRSKSVATTYTPMIISDNNLLTNNVIPKPFESCCGQQENESIKNVDSEIIITLKNCQNEKFRKVSLLQVLHKTNECYEDDIKDNELCNKHEDPVTILSKVRDRFGAIVKREMRNANKKQLSSEKINIEATFHKMSTCLSNPSCSRITSQSSLSDSVFASTTNVL